MFIDLDGAKMQFKINNLIYELNERFVNEGTNEK